MFGRDLLGRAAVVVVLSIGCGGAQQERGPQPAPSELMQSPAYQQGLANVLAALPEGISQYVVDWVRVSYDLGFAVGDGERSLDSEMWRRTLVGRGCMAALSAFPAASQEQHDQDALKCSEGMPALPGHGWRGAEYSKAKLTIVEKGIEGGGGRSADLLNDTFEVGYRKGFFAGAPPPAFDAAKTGCLLVAELRRMTDVAGSRCGEIALEIQTEFLAQTSPK